MKNIVLKISIATMSIIGFVSLSQAGVPTSPVILPEPGTFGMFAAAAAVAIIAARIMKK